MSKQCVISVNEEAVLVREVKTFILNSSYSTAQMQGITNAFTRGSERVYARQQTRSHANANAFTKGG